jgi:sulfatase maturation enzyme AslB (radical SAM superfamily)
MTASNVVQVFLKAMAETGQVKLYGKEPTLTEVSLYRARKHLYKEERYNIDLYFEPVILYFST